jgi:hypothetical protein
MYRPALDGKGLATPEKESKEAEARLWEDAAPVSPWEWRKPVPAAAACIRVPTM